MDFTLSDVQQSWQERGRTLGRELSHDAAPADVVAGAARLGLIDARDDLLAAAVAIDAIDCESASAAITLALHTSVTLGVAGDDRFSPLLRGELVGALSLSSESVPEDDAGRLVGRASWVAPVTAGGLAIVGARSGGTLAAYAVALDAAGVTIDSMGTAALPGINCGHVSFAHAPAAAFGTPVPFMARARILLAAAGLGMGRRALREALVAAHAYSRTGAGGEQTVQGLLADGATELDAAMLLTWKAAASETLSLAEASMAKLAATEATQRAVARATQVVGADSFRRGHVVERLAQDVRALELFAGRTEALREAAAEETVRKSEL
jgi:alkylation response protein AidB-like acyl-CoA dehydrogenase